MAFSTYIELDYHLRKRELHRIIGKRMTEALTSAEQKIYDYEVDLEMAGQGFKGL